MDKLVSKPTESATGTAGAQSLRRALSLGTETNLVRTIRSVGWALSTGSADKTEPPIEAGVKTEPAPQSA